MRMLFLPLLLLGLLPSAFCQNNLSSKTISTNGSEKERWNLDKYVWSHTHYKTGKNDKPVIDFDAIDKWPAFGSRPDGSLEVSVSPDGRFFAYTTIKGSGLPQYARKEDSLIVQSTQSIWRKTFSKSSPGFFASDSKQYVFKDKETLYFLDLNSGDSKSVEGLGQYKLPDNGKNEWLAYQLKNNNDVVLQNLVTGKKETFENISDFGFDNRNAWLVLQLKSESSDLQLYNLKNGKKVFVSSVASYVISNNAVTLITKTKDDKISFTNLTNANKVIVWQALNATQKVKGIAADDTGQQIVFTVENENKNISIWYWKQGMEKAVMKVNDGTIGIEDLLIQSSVSFTDNGNYIQFSLQPKPDERKPMEDAVRLDIWSSTDTTLQSTQPYLLKAIKPLKAVINIETGKIVHIDNQFEKLFSMQGDFALVHKKNRDVFGDKFWKTDYDKDSNWLVSLKDGNRTLLPTRDWDHTFWFSPGGRYLVYFDGKKDCNYYSYDVKSGEEKNISENVPEKLLRHDQIYTAENSSPLIGPAAWIEGEEGLLVYDDYDIWKLDLSGKKPATCITNGYGRKHNTLFSLQNSDRALIGFPNSVSANGNLLLKAFNRTNKQSGFFKKRVKTAGGPEVLFIGPYFFQELVRVNSINKGFKPLKASNANTWILLRQSATEAPNYFLTNDFKSYKQLTNLQPESDYNWLTTELVSFPQLDGTISQGVLYKPENFDSTKKYPLIISFYIDLSDHLYQYSTPEYMDAPHLFPNAAWMVSHGYLVFVPDIYFKKNQWGPSTVNTVDGAAHYLKILPYVDSAHLGAVGHSNSGRFGYYLLTHSKSFAAMSIGAGTTGPDVISLSLSLGTRNGTENLLELAERGAGGTALGNLWENKGSWIDHTAVLQADKTTSPLLLFHNDNDGASLQGPIELFIALRRLERPVWWFNYEKEGHGLFKLRDLRDFTIRYTQFFDYYLKGSPMPMWMKQGVPFKLKGVETRYELLTK